MSRKQEVCGGAGGRGEREANNQAVRVIRLGGGGGGGGGRE